MDRWPLGLGFERYYGFLGAETSQWDPPLVQDNTHIEPPRTPAEGYHLTEDLADQAIAMVLDQQQATPDKPFFCYLATGAAHAPHQVPPQWIEPYRGRFDHGWEAERPATFGASSRRGIVPAGHRADAPAAVGAGLGDPVGRRAAAVRPLHGGLRRLRDPHRRPDRPVPGLPRPRAATSTTPWCSSCPTTAPAPRAARRARSTSRTPGSARLEDVAEALRHIDELGGHRAFNHYPWGWAWAGNTPLQLWKRYAWLGGVRTPLIVRWPGHLAGPGAVRPQFCHAIDLFATVLDAAGVPAPELRRRGDPTARRRVPASPPPSPTRRPPSPRRTQYFEMHGSRGIYHDGWKATTDYVSPLFGEREFLTGSQDFDDDHWALFNLDDDFAEAHDLSAAEPDRVAGAARAVVGRGRAQPGAAALGGPEVQDRHPSGRVPAAG